MNDIYEILAEIRPEYDFKDSTDFIEDGMLDSFDIISLIDIISEKYGVSVDGLDIIPENFCSAQAIADLIRKNGGDI
ncbi:MAG: acyl carrier protein [Oscillospiraceae bacterium]|nr:acyl carrier protein [Oscillospiraceae bacterium]